MSLYLIMYGTGRALIEGLRMDSLYIGSIRASQLLSILLIVFGVGFIFVSFLLHRKGKIKSLTELEPYYQANLAKGNKTDIKIEIQKDDTLEKPNNPQQEESPVKKEKEDKKKNE